MEIPICFRPREGVSKLKFWRDGWKILRMLTTSVWTREAV
jgi:hypothetical protein